MGRLGRYLGTLRRDLKIESFRDELEGCQLVSGPDFLVQELRTQPGPVAVLPVGLLPGFHLLGRFESQIGRFGNITLVHGDRQARSCPSIAGLELYLYPLTYPPHDVLWSDELEPARVGRRLLMACLHCRQLAPEVVQFGYRWVHTRDDGEVKAAPLFPLLTGPTAGVRLNLEELGRARAITLVNGEPPPHQAGTLCLQDCETLRRLLLRHNIKFQSERNLKHPDSDWVDRRRWEPRGYFEPAWGHATRKGALVSIPIWEQGSLSVDTESLKLRTPVEGAEGLIELNIGNGLTTNMTRETRRGDLKVHEIHMLTISDGNHTIKYRARFKDYYEGGSVQAELDVYQDKARSILFRLANALENPARMGKFLELF